MAKLRARSFDGILGGKDQKSEHLSIEFLSGWKTGSFFYLSAKIQELKELESVGWSDNSIKIGSNFTNRSKVFSLRFEFANLDWDIRQLCQGLADGAQKVRIMAKGRQIDSLFLCLDIKIDCHEPIPGNNELWHGLVSMTLRKET